MFKNKTLLITGGTGSFGNTVLNQFIKSNLKEIRVFSRDEKKQDDLRKYYKSSKLKFYLGDVRDFNSIASATRGVDYLFHAAALKQVPSCEFHPLEAVKTNILGTENVLEASIQNKVKKVICLSTDKAVYPINAMGISKAMMEKVIVAKSREAKKTIICITRYGNVMGSRGSVIPLFIDQIISNKPLTITDPNMTRFMMSLQDAVELVLFAFKNGKAGDILIQKSPATSISVLTDALCKIFSKSKYPKNIIGTRHGEKLFETLLSREEMSIAINYKDYFKLPPDKRDLNYEKYIDLGDVKISTANEYNSHNTRMLKINEMIRVLSKLKCTIDALKLI